MKGLGLRFCGSSACSIFCAPVYSFGDTVVGFDHPMPMTCVSNKTHPFGSVGLKKHSLPYCILQNEASSSWIGGLKSLCSDGWGHLTDTAQPQPHCRDKNTCACTSVCITENKNLSGGAAQWYSLACVRGCMPSTIQNKTEALIKDMKKP